MRQVNKSLFMQKAIALARQAMGFLPLRGRAAPLWITAAIVVMTWAPKTEADPGQPRQALADAQRVTAAGNVEFGALAGDGDLDAISWSRRGEHSPVQIAQVATGESGKAQQSPESEQYGDATLGCELAIARREVELLQYVAQEHDRAEKLEVDLAAARRNIETQAALAAKADDEASRLKQAAEGTTELARSMQNERARAQALAQDLAMARSKISAYEAQAGKAADEVTEVRKAAASTELALRKSVQDERERAARLEQDLATARRDVETQVALVTNAKAQSDRLKLDLASSLQLKELLRKEQERADALAQELSTVRTQLYAHEARPGQAAEQAILPRQTAERGSGAQDSSLHREHANEQVERELTDAQRTGDEPSSEDGTGGLKAVTDGQIVPDKPVEAVAKPRAHETSAASTRDHVNPNPQEAMAAARLLARANVLLRQGDIGAARIVLERAVDLGSAQAGFVLAETFDPLILPKWGTYGTRGDAAKARDLYAKADAVGIKEAKARFEALRP